jgi:heat shock protein HtpX
MAMMRRIFYFSLVNIAVIVTISILLNILGIGPWLAANGIQYSNLLIMCALFGFGGAFFSLATSRWMAKTFMGVKVIDPQSSNPGERELVQMVYRLARGAGLPAMPEVGIYESPEVNAFATGRSKSSALVAVSSGLLQRMDSAAVEGVLGHELTHVANGDMVTMTLVQGVVNTFVMFFARILAWGVAQSMQSRDDRDRGGAPSFWIQWMLISVFEIVFGLLGAVVVSFFSRWREFRADAGGARLAGKDRMIHALESLKQTNEVTDDRFPSVANLKINGHPRGLMALLQSHPPLDVRIAALRSAP